MKEFKTKTVETTTYELINYYATSKDEQKILLQIKKQIEKEIREKFQKHAMNFDFYYCD